MTDDDGLPTSDQLSRIERGVMRRIGLRRMLARRVAGGAAAVVLVGGGFGLVLSGLHSSGSSSTSGSAGGAAVPGAAGGTVAVRCSAQAGSDSNRNTTVRVPVGGLPQAALDACAGTVAFGSEAGTTTGSDAASGSSGSSSSASGSSASSGTNGTAASAGPSAAAKPSALVLCVDVDGSYVVLDRHGSGAATCVRAGMEPYQTP